MKKVYFLKPLSFVVGLVVLFAGAYFYASANNTTTLYQTINPGTLSVDIVDGSYASVVVPSVTFPAKTFDFACNSSSATLGTTTEQIYIVNPDAADNGWTASIAGSATTATWTSGTNSYDFNDTNGAGCTDNAGDADSVAGRLTVNPATATLGTGGCLNCTTTGISLGSSSAFNEGTVDSITLVNAAAGSNDIGDWTVRGISLTQTVPAEQPADTYSLNMVVSVVSI